MKFCRNLQLCHQSRRATRWHISVGFIPSSSVFKDVDTHEEDSNQFLSNQSQGDIKIGFQQAETLIIYV